VSNPIRLNLLAETKPGGKGFFGLTELEKFVSTVLEPAALADQNGGFTLDFSKVRVWDVSVLLWLIVGLNHYKFNSGLDFRLRLPEVTLDMLPEEKMATERCADYLRRWRFDRALQNLDPDPSCLLVESQSDYFKGTAPRKYYVSTNRETTEHGILQSLISRSLAEIKNLADAEFSGTVPISPERVAKCIRDFQSERIGDILFAQCGIPKENADLFSDHLLTEALLNVKEHPDASIAMVAISIMGTTGELVLCVVDNGMSIPQTLWPRYTSDHSLSDSDYSSVSLGVENKAAIINYATQAGVTSKESNNPSEFGMGLTYIKNDTVRTFGGKLTIISDSTFVKYENDEKNVSEKHEWRAPWKGNLIRIAIPTRVKQSATV
jgi:hypothetical protein